MKIIVDSREKKPLLFEDYDNVHIFRDKLDCGDYSLCAHDMPNDDRSVVIERKSGCNELVRNLGIHWKNFANELELMREYDNKYLIICGPENFYDLYQRKHTRIHPNYAYSKLLEIELNYGVHIKFFHNRKDAESFIRHVFSKILKLTEQDE